MAEVPSVIFIHKGKVIDKFQGTNVPVLVEKVKETIANASANTAAIFPAINVQESDIRSRLSRLVKAAPVMLFMKGIPDAPRCGFSRQIVEVLRSENIEFGFFDILSDDSVRQVGVYNTCDYWVVLFSM